LEVSVDWGTEDSFRPRQAARQACGSATF